ncbi:MAG: PaaI family thioesterase [Burkholderiales bacterium]
MDAQKFNAIGKNRLPGLVGMEVLAVEKDLLTCRLPVRPEVMAPNGFLHAASVIALADTACGYGTIANLPEGAKGFTTIELKSNFLGTVREGAILCKAKPAHRGRTTQVWDAVIQDETSGKTIALFRCTQMILW